VLKNISNIELFASILILNIFSCRKMFVIVGLYIQNNLIYKTFGLKIFLVILTFSFYYRNDHRCDKHSVKVINDQGKDIT